MGKKMGGRGFCRAEMAASGEWQVVLEGSAPALPPKLSVVREHDHPVNNLPDAE